MALTEDEVANRFPIHWMVWNNQHEELKTALASKKYSNEDIELKDPRGRTPLLLAVTLGYIDCVRVLIDAGADVNCEKDGWTAVQEATATGNAELLALVLCQRDHRRRVVRSEGIPDLLRRLSLAPDFYVEMKWEFTSWVPLVSRMCPFDTYKIYKRGGNVRVDTTLVGFENNRWQRGDRTYIFRGQGKSASLMELDHEAGTSWTEYLEPLEDRAVRPASKHLVEQRLAHPLAINYLDTDKICFERNKSGIWGWRQDKTENVNGYECKVFGANNVELVSMTRTEHLPRADKDKRSPRQPLAGLLALADTDNELFEGQPDDDSRDSSPLTPREEVLPTPRDVTWSEYFGTETLQQDIGKPKEIHTKIQKFKATLWLCEDYPLQLQEQIMPILDLMAAVSSPHFAKLKDFVQMQLPAGFPVKIEIPLFHVLNARITFGNIFATETPVPHIDHIQEGDRLSCVVDDICFNVGRGSPLIKLESVSDFADRYRDAAAPGGGLCGADDEQLLQYAIQQSLMQPGTHDDQVDVWEALRGASPAAPSPLLLQEDTQLQRAIEASLALASLAPTSTLAAVAAVQPDAVAVAVAVSDADADEFVAEPELAEALALSAKEHHDLKLQLESEQRALDEALRLSLLDN